MKKLMFQAVLAASLALVVGCGKKDEKSATSDKATEAQPADKAPGAATPSPVAPVAPAEPPKLMDVADVPADIPQECKDARASYVKIHDCAKLDEKTRATMVKSWNDMVEGTFKQWKTGSEKDKQTVLDICKKLPETANMLTKDC